MSDQLAPSLHFYRRTGDEETGYVYDAITTKQPAGAQMRTHWLPLVGDLIGLWGVEGGHSMYRVLERAWHHPQWGSANWPYGKDKPVAGPMVHVIVEVAEGPFRNERPDPEDVEDDR